MSLDWDKLTDQNFEELCYEFLSMNGFENLEWYGRSGNDRGRDITCTKSEILLGSFRRTESFLVQCKKWVSRPPEPSDLNNTIAWADFHKPSALIIMVSNTLTANTRDWLKEIGKSKSYEIFTYEESNFEIFLDGNKGIFQKYFKTRKPKSDDYSADLQQRLLLVLAKTPNRTATEISEAASVSITKTESCLKKLTLANLIYVKDKRYSIKSMQTGFLNVAEQLLTFGHGFDFVASEYANSFINHDLVSYVELRYFLHLSQQDKDNVLKIMKISPSAMHYAFFGSSELYKNGFDHLNSLKLKEPERTKWADSFSHQLIFEMLKRLLTDLTHPDCKVTLIKEKIDGYYMNIEIKMANIERLFLSAKSESGIMLFKTIGKVSAGQLLSVGDPDVYLRTAILLSNLGLSSKALENYDLAISQVKDATKLKAAYNNKGVELMKSKTYSEALKCFDEALKIDPNLKQAIENRKKCLDELGRK
jgi:tetratricopeptide (TPR) repeat protein